MNTLFPLLFVCLLFCFFMQLERESWDLFLESYWIQLFQFESFLLNSKTSWLISSLLKETAGKHSGLFFFYLHNRFLSSQISYSRQILQSLVPSAGISTFSYLCIFRIKAGVFWKMLNISLWFWIFVCKHISTQLPFINKDVFTEFESNAL